MFDPGGFEPRPPSSNKRQFHIEVDHDSQGVLPVAITIQMPKPPQTAHQIPSLQLRRGRKREFGTSRDSQDRGPPSWSRNGRRWIFASSRKRKTTFSTSEAHCQDQDCSKLLSSNFLGEMGQRDGTDWGLQASHETGHDDDGQDLHRPLHANYKKECCRCRMTDATLLLIWLRTARAQCRDHQHSEVAATTAP